MSLHLSSRKSLACVAAIVLAPLLAPHAQAQFDQFGELTNFSEEIRILGDGISLDPDTNEVTYDGEVAIEYTDVKIYADRARYNSESQRVWVEGNVVIYQGEFMYKGEEATYNLMTNSLSSESLKTYVPTPNGMIYTDLGRFTVDTSSSIDQLTTFDSIITAHDSAHPNWVLNADQLDIYPEDRVVFRNMVYRVGNIPLFYLPYWSQPFDDQLGYMFTPGYEGDWGGFLLNRYGLMLGKDRGTIMQIRADYRAERGFGGGLDFYSQRWRSNSNFGRLFMYYADDEAPFAGLSRTDQLDSDVDNKRYRVNFQHRVYLKGYYDTWDVDPDTGEAILAHRGGPRDPGFYVDFDLNLLSDEFFYEDFFPAESTIEPQPDSIINLVKQDARYEVSLLTRLRLSDAFRRDERLPDLALNVVRQPLDFFGLGLQFQSNSSIAWITEELSGSESRRVNRLRAGIRDQLAQAELNGEPVDPLLSDELDRLALQGNGQDYFRSDNYQQFSRPFSFDNGLTIVPRAGVRVTSYNNVNQGSDEVRVLGHFGTEASMKFSRRWDDVYSRALGLDGIMHVMQPYVDWSYVGGDQLGDDFVAIDRLNGSTRPRTLDLAQFSATDQINEWNIIRWGIQNHLLTRRDGRSYSWLAYNTFIDYYADDPEFDRDFSNWYHEMTWRPLPWLKIDMDGQVPLDNGPNNFYEWNSRLGWMPRDWVEFGFGHRYLDEHPLFQDSSQFYWDAYVRLNEDWGVSMEQRYEADDGVLEYQRYGLYRELRNMDTSLSLMLRDEREDTEFGLVFGLTLKQFPQLDLPLSLTPGGS